MAALLVAVVGVSPTAAQVFPGKTSLPSNTASPGRYAQDASPRVLVRPSADSLLGRGADDPQPVVARLHCSDGNQRIVILPSGEIEVFLDREVVPTDRPFTGSTKDELAKALVEGKFKNFKTKQTKRFLYVYNTSEMFYQGTSRILETMYPGVMAYCKKQKLDVHEAELPLVVIMFRTKGEFDNYRKMPAGVLAYYDGRTNWVCMYEMSDLVKISPPLALKQAVSTVAHEGVHQILENIGVQQRLSRWPMWISEGIAEFFAPTDISSDVRWKGIGTVNDLRMAELEHYIKTGQGKFEPGTTMRVTARATELTSTGYASAWALTHFLAQKRPKDFLEFMQEVSQRKPLEEFRPDDDGALFERHFGDEYAALEALELKHLQTLPYVNPLTRLGLEFKRK